MFGKVFSIENSTRDLTLIKIHRSTTLGVFLFFMNNIGGNLPVLVEPLSKSIGYRESLWVFYVGAYFASKYFYLK